MCVPTGHRFSSDVPDIIWIGMFTSICSCDGMGYTPIEFQLSLLNGAGTDGTLVSSETAVAPWGLYGFLYFDFSGTDLVIGNAYTAVFSQITPNPPPMGGGWASVDGTTDVYPGGMSFWADPYSGGPGKPHPADDFYLRV